MCSFGLLFHYQILQVLPPSSLSSTFTLFPFLPHSSHHHYYLDCDISFLNLPHLFPTSTPSHCDRDFCKTHTVLTSFTLWFKVLNISHILGVREPKSLPEPQDPSSGLLSSLALPSLSSALTFHPTGLCPLLDPLQGLLAGLLSAKSTSPAQLLRLHLTSNQMLLLQENLPLKLLRRVPSASSWKACGCDYTLLVWLSD